MKRLTILIFMTLFFALLQMSLYAQCTSEAGQYPPDDIKLCEDTFIPPIPSNVNTVSYTHLTLPTTPYV